jgi:hypothetical protein
MRLFFVSMLVACALVACNSVNDVAVSAQLSLDSHQAKWKQSNYQSYSFDIVQQKFSSNTNVHVTVSGNSIVSVIDNKTGQPPEINWGWPTIDELYDDAQSAMDAKNVDVRMEFDDQYNYPTLLEITANTPGGPYSAAVSNLTP